MYICVTDKEGNIPLHCNIRNTFEPFNILINKYKNSISVEVESVTFYRVLRRMEFFPA
jgi:hypothetical protein